MEKYRTREEKEALKISLHLKILYGILLINCSATLLTVIMWYTSHVKGQGRCDNVLEGQQNIQDARNTIPSHKNLTQDEDDESEFTKRIRRSYSATVSIHAS